MHPCLELNDQVIHHFDDLLETHLAPVHCDCDEIEARIAFAGSLDNVEGLRLATLHLDEAA